MFVCFDFEWTTKNTEYSKKGNELFKAASFVDSNGKKKVFLFEDYQRTFGQKAEYALLLETVNYLNKYQYSFGWYSKGFEFFNEEKKRTEGKNSDLVMLDKRLIANGIPSVIGYNRFGMPYIKGASHIDAMKLYEKPMIKVSIYKNKYTGLGLEMVSKAIVGRGKYKGFSGKDFDSISDTEEKRNYALEDSQLVFDILEHNNYEILKLMLSISNLTGIRLEIVCNGGVSTLWTKILDDVISNELENTNYQNNSRMLLLQKYYSWEQPQQKQQSSIFQEEKEVYRILGEDGDEDEEEQGEDNDKHQQQQKQKEQEEEKHIKFEGGKVIDPATGEHRNVCVFDVASLYPTMVINYNISLDTVFCDCCKNEPLAKVPREVTDIKDYWICKKQQGIFTERMLHFTKERFKHKRLGNEVESQGLKILINAGYGVFGYENFKYFNKDVAILIAAYGRYTLTKMIELAESQGFRVVYGDTDSLFIVDGANQYEPISSNKIENFTTKCSEALHVEVKHERTFDKVIIAKKKHYLGIFPDKNKKPVVKGFEGIKSDRVEWVRNVFAQMLEDYKNNNNTDLISKIRQGVLDLEHWNIKEPQNMLLKTTKISKDPEDYRNNCLQKRIGLELGLSKGDVASYYLADNDKGYAFDVNECSIPQYRKMLINAVKDILKILGYDIEQDLLSSVANSLNEVI